MNKVSKILFWLLVLGSLISIALTFEQTVVRGDYKRTEVEFRE
ncbi:MAG: hypothetical protein AAB415_02405 [Patescibacteria group bacterium]